MRRIRNFVIGGLQHKVLNLVLVAILLVVCAYSAVFAYQTKSIETLVHDTNKKQQDSIEQISTNSLSAQIKSNLLKNTKLEAAVANDLFQELADEVQMLGDYTRHVFSIDPPKDVVLASVPDKSQDGEIVQQLLAMKGVDPTDAKYTEQVSRISSMREMMTTLYRNANVNSCFVGTPDGIFVIADDRSASKFLEDGSVKPIQVTERPWYVGALKKEGLYFTDVERDNYVDEIGIVCSLPVYVDGKLVAIVGADLFLDTLEAAVAASKNINNGFSCIISENGHVIFSPERSGPFQVKTSDTALDLRKFENEALAKFVDRTLKGSSSVQVVKIGSAQFYLAGALMDTIGWAVISVVNQQTALQPVVQMVRQHDSINNQTVVDVNKSIYRSLRIIGILMLVILGLAVTASLLRARKIVHPLNTMSKRVEELEGDNLRFVMEDTFRTGDEIEVLASAFANMSSKTVRYIDEIKFITAEKERLGAELDMAKSIQESQLPHEFPPYPERNEFDIFASMTPAKQVGGDFYDFYLVDDDHICLVMADVSGKGVPAALFMMISRILLKNRILGGDSPGKALWNVNNQLAEANQADMFVTVWIAVIEISTGKGIAANAGHEHPVLKRAGGVYELVKYRHSLAVGAMEGVPFGEHAFELKPGDALFVYTDGVPEATSEEDELFGNDRMLKALNRNPDAAPEEVLGNVMQGIREFVEDAEQFDDITMLCFTYHGA